MERRDHAKGLLERAVSARAGRRLLEVEESLALAELAETYELAEFTLFEALADPDVLHDADQIRRCEEKEEPEALEEKRVPGGAEGTPAVSEFLSLEVGPALGLSQLSAANLVASVLDLKYRHPLLWAAFLECRIERWQAARITTLTQELGIAAAHRVDQQLAECVDRMSFGRLMRFARGAVAQADPEAAAARERKQKRGRGVFVGNHDSGTSTVFARIATRDALRLEQSLQELAGVMVEHGDTRSLDERRASALGWLADPDRAANWLSGDATAAPRKGRSIVYIHLAAESLVNQHDPEQTPAVARVEGIGPITSDLLPEFLSGTNVTVRPVVDLNGLPPVDAYEIPRMIREAVLNRHPVDGFPFSSLPARHLDLDHIRPFQRGPAGGRGQTHVDGLLPQSRRAHRAKTRGDWLVRPDSPGVAEWTSPLGRRYRVNPDGTTPLTRPRLMVGHLRIVRRATMRVRTVGKGRKSTDDP